jgi:hypothetical protein
MSSVAAAVATTHSKVLPLLRKVRVGGLSIFRIYRGAYHQLIVGSLNLPTGRVAGRADGCSEGSLDRQYSEETMLAMHHDASRPSRVTVAFEDGAVSFVLSNGATFEDLADRLDRLGERHYGKPVAIAVKLAAASDVCATAATEAEAVIAAKGRT